MYKLVSEIVQPAQVSEKAVKDKDGKTIFTYREIAMLLRTLFYNFRINVDMSEEVELLIDFICYNYNLEIQRMWDVVSATYNPIENYNKTSTITDAGSASNTHSNVPADSTAEKETSHDSATSGNTRTEHTSGNIGVMSTQSMILQEIEVRTKSNIKMFVVQRFKEFYIIAW